MNEFADDIQYAALAEVLREKFGEDSDMYRDGIAAFLAGEKSGEIPEPYRKYWEPYKTNNLLHHITIEKNIEVIRETGLEPRNPHPRPWTAMKAIFMGEPGDPLFAKSEQAVIKHVADKGDNPVLLKIRTKNKLYKSVEPKRTFQVISLDPIAPEEVVEYLPLHLQK
ncbi:MAG TPA: hypothetical protein VF272_02725 [Candidatus Saccharimonadia bacterium]